MISRNQIAAVIALFTFTAFILGLCVGFSQPREQKVHAPEPVNPAAPVALPEAKDYVHYEATYHPTWDLPTTTVVWVRDPIEVQAQLDLFERNNPNMEAHAVSVHYPGECTIYAFEPKHSADEEATWRLGHEFLHCFRGAYHD